jgi:hypothetical protein
MGSCRYKGKRAFSGLEESDGLKYGKNITCKIDLNFVAFVELDNISHGGYNSQ